MFGVLGREYMQIFPDYLLLYYFIYFYYIVFSLLYLLGLDKGVSRELSATEHACILKVYIT